ncbi:unnamed protein product [Pleuronectes platessa]|uniref:Uncharacterized protein n=1 Tax=Pleuronectes platessa TaxID=8262 RepID=A0A9N7UWD1_PLEPL|nr:unnamed protein product [Pleuronectes platessa]
MRDFSALPKCVRGSHIESESGAGDRKHMSEAYQETFQSQRTLLNRIELRVQKIARGKAMTEVLDVFLSVLCFSLLAHPRTFQPVSALTLFPRALHGSSPDLQGHGVTATDDNFDRVPLSEPL